MIRRPDNRARPRRQAVAAGNVGRPGDHRPTRSHPHDHPPRAARSGPATPPSPCPPRARAPRPRRRRRHRVQRGRRVGSRRREPHRPVGVAGSVRLAHGLPGPRGGDARLPAVHARPRRRRPGRHGRRWHRRHRRQDRRARRRRAVQGHGGTGPARHGPGRRQGPGRRRGVPPPPARWRHERPEPRRWTRSSRTRCSSSRSACATTASTSRTRSSTAAGSRSASAVRPARTARRCPTLTPPRSRRPRRPAAATSPAGRRSRSAATADAGSPAVRRAIVAGAGLALVVGVGAVAASSGALAGLAPVAGTRGQLDARRATRRPDREGRPAGDGDVRGPRRDARLRGLPPGPRRLPGDGHTAAGRGPGDHPRPGPVRARRRPPAEAPVRRPSALARASPRDVRRRRRPPAGGEPQGPGLRAQGDEGQRHLGREDDEGRQALAEGDGTDAGRDARRLGSRVPARGHPRPVAPGGGGFGRRAGGARAARRRRRRAS